LHLGAWRYYLLLQVQALLVPSEVRRMLQLNSNVFVASLVETYRVVGTFNLQPIVHSLLIPPQYWAELRRFDRRAAA
jgi:hypothetical protein